MAELQDFAETTPTTLEDLQTTSPKTVVSNAASNKNMAAYAAMNSSDPSQATQVYEQADAEFESGEGSQVAADILRQAKEKSFGSVRDAVIDFLGNPDYSDEVKQKVATDMLDQENERYSIRNITSEQALIQDSDPEETAEQETVRVSLSDHIEELNAYKKQKQAILNQELAKSNPSVMKSIADFAEYLIPFGESKMVGGINKELSDGDSGYLKAGVFLGKSKEDIRDYLHKLPIDKRMEATQKLVDIINEHSSILLPDENDMARADILRTALEDGYYGEGSSWIDTITSLLDVTGLVGATRKLGSKAVSQVQKGLVRSTVQPVSVAENVKDLNPEKAKAIHAIMDADESGEAAQALYGTTRDEAIANEILPEVDGDTVRNKVGSIDSKVKVNEEVKRFVESDGKIYFTQGERQQAVDTAKQRFTKGSSGISMRQEMLRVDNTGEGAVFKAIYAPPQGGWVNPVDALDRVKEGLKLSDKEVQLLRWENGEYVPTNLKELDAIEAITRSKAVQKGVKIGKFKPDYVVQVDHKYELDPLDVTNWEALPVARYLNIFDRSKWFSGKDQGSLTRHIFDAHSLLDPTITFGATKAVDKASQLEKKLLDLGNAFSSHYVKVPKQKREQLDYLIKKANYESKWPTPAEMVGQGLDEADIKALDSWKETWDTLYWMENRDLAKTLHGQGFKLLSDDTTDTRLFVKPAKESSIPRGERVFDPSSGEIVTLSDRQIKALYEKNPEAIGKAKRPITHNGESVDYVLANRTEGTSNLRDINADTQVLTYREGYYSVRYEAPKYIIEKGTDANGKEFSRAVEVAGSTKEAIKAQERLELANPHLDYSIRGDVKREQLGSDEYWDINTSGGRAAQRVRGKRLEDNAVKETDRGLNDRFVMNPAESLVTSVRSAANRVPMRDYLDATKTRFMATYGDLFKDGKFPENAAAISSPGNQESKHVADARTTWEYIRSLENGYINGMDEGYRAIMNMMAKIVGKVSGKGEEALINASTGKPSALMRGTAFTLYLALNPIRQLVVQAHQAVQLMAHNPSYVFSQSLLGDWGWMTAMKAGVKVPDSVLKGVGRTRKEAEAMFKAYEDSGLSAAIDKQNLVRGSLLEMSELSKVKPSSGVTGALKRAGSASLSFMRKVGFDAGEEINMMTAWLSHYDEAVKKGMDMSSSTTLDMVSAKARNFTYNMNKAGDMPYNSNTLAVIAQFQQVPHKAMLQYTNKGLDNWQKARLFTLNSMMYTLPPAMIYDLMGDNLPEDPVVRDAVVQGIEGAAFNYMLNLGSEDNKTDLDWSFLAASDMYGTYDFVSSLWTVNPQEIFSSTPSGQLFFGGNPRITNFAKTTARYMGLIDDYSDPTEFSDVSKSFLQLSSGFSNAFKAEYARKAHQKINSLGGVTDSNVTDVEAYAQYLGIGTMDELTTRYISNKLYQDSDKLKTDVTQWYKELKQRMAGEFGSQREAEAQLKVLGEAWRVFGTKDTEARKIIRSLIAKDVRKGDDTLFRSVLQTTGWKTKDEVLSMIDLLPNMTDEERKTARDTVKAMYKGNE